MRKERLLKLADFLDDLPEEFFNFDYIVKGRNEYQGYAISTEKALRIEMESGFTENCGAVACAVGWCPAVFEELKWDGCSVVYKEGSPDYSRWEEGMGPCASFVTVQDFLVLDDSQAANLFEPGCYIDEYGVGYKVRPSEVAARIRKMVSAESSLD